MSKLLSVFLAVFIAQAVCQDRYIVEVVEYLKTNHNTTSNLCPATVITERHVLTTAACAKASNNLQELAIELASTDATNTETPKSKDDLNEFLNFKSQNYFPERIEVDTVFIHPNYTSAHATINNIAVILVSDLMDLICIDLI